MLVGSNRLAFWAWLVSVSLFAACGYDNELNFREQGIHDYQKAYINIRVTTSPGDRYCRNEPLQLCIGNHSQCIDIVRDASAESPPGGDFCRNQANDCYDQTTECYIPGHVAAGDAVVNDHPFVAHPDDWDRVYLKGSSAYSLSRVRFNLRYDGHFWTPLLLDVNFGAHPQPSTASGIFDLSSYIRDRREQVFESHSGIGAGHFYELPWHVREAAYDLNQVGMYKYAPFDRSGQNGCNEFTGYMFENYSHAFDYACIDCLSETNPVLFRQHKLFKIDFIKSAAGERTGVRGIFRCLNPACTLLGNSHYVPRMGDALIARWRGGDGHLMMIVGGMNMAQAPGNLFEIPVIDLAGRIRLSTRVYDASERSPVSRPEFHEWYVVPIDRLNTPKATSSGKHASYSGFRTTQQTILFGTTL